jgi:predicted metal-dependent peptidase
MFVVCHEALHIVLQHGSRFLEGVDNKISNIAMDVVVNHSLTRDFGFIKEEVDSNNEYCWVDNIFKDKKYLGFPYPDDESTEFYYNEIEKQKEDNYSNGSGDEVKGKLVDDHSGIADQQIEEVVKQVIDQLDDSEKEQLSNALNNINKSETSIGSWFKINKIEKSRKKKWESIIKKWQFKTLRFSDNEKEQWIRKSRRMNSFDNSLILPSNAEIECFHLDKNKINIHFFLDTSGSCINLAERFFTAANSLPKEKFNIRLFCFDTKVVETNLQSQKIYGGGGTCFKIIEDFIQSEKNNNKYPAAIFVITDGIGSKVEPEHPNRWHWFLTERNIKYIPKKSFFYNLEDFE